MLSQRQKSNVTDHNQSQYSSGILRDIHPSFDQSRNIPQKGALTHRSSSKNLSNQLKTHESAKQLKSLSQMQEIIKRQMSSSQFIDQNRAIQNDDQSNKVFNYAQKENCSQQANSQLQSRRQSAIHQKKSQQVNAPLDNNNHVQMQIFMNHPAFQKQRAKLTTLATSQKPRNSSQLQSRILNLTNGSIRSNSKQMEQSQIESKNEQCMMNMVAKTYDFSSLDSLENEKEQKSFENALMLNSSKVQPSFIEHQTLSSATHNSIESINEKLMFNTDGGKQKGQQQIYQQNIDISFSENNSNVCATDPYSTLDLFSSREIQLQNNPSIAKKLIFEEEKCLAKNQFINYSDATPKFPEQMQQLSKQQVDLEAMQTQKEYIKLKEIIKRVEQEEKLRQKRNKSQSLMKQQSNYTNSKNCTVARELSTEECSPTINPKFDLARRNSTDILHINKFSKRSQSLCHHKSNLSHYKDTTAKKILNNKLAKTASEKQFNENDEDTKFKFKIFLMFMQLMKQGKDPMPYLLDFYLKWKQIKPHSSHILIQ